VAIPDSFDKWGHAILILGAEELESASRRDYGTPLKLLIVAPSAEVKKGEHTFDLNIAQGSISQ
jgi:hypothetical protein